MMDKSFQDSLETIEKFDRLQIVGTLFDNIILSIACVRDSMGSYMEMDNVIADVDPYFCAICKNIEKAAMTLFEIENALNLDDAVKEARKQIEEIINDYFDENIKASGNDVPTE